MINCDFIILAYRTLRTLDALEWNIPCYGAFSTAKFLAVAHFRKMAQQNVIFTAIPYTYMVRDR